VAIAAHSLMAFRVLFVSRIKKTLKKVQLLLVFLFGERKSNTESNKVQRTPQKTKQKTKQN
jgi:hypothetical protein